MKNAFYERLSPNSLAQLDLVDYYGEGMMITRIIVPKEHRGKGVGSRLLKACLSEADKEGVTLWLEINSYGEMTYDQLEAWYKRHGFVGSSIFKRKAVRS